MTVEVEAAYLKYVDTDDLHKLEVSVNIVQNPAYDRVRNVLGPMLREAVPPDIKAYLLQTNLLEPEQALLFLYRKCQPRGSAERTALLDQLQDPFSGGKKAKPKTFRQTADMMREYERNGTSERNERLRS